MSSSSNTQGNDTAQKKEWFQRLPFWPKDSNDLQNTPRWRRIYDNVTTVVLMALFLLVVGNALFGHYWTATKCFGALLFLMFVMDRVNVWIVDPIQRYKAAKATNDEADKVTSRVNPPEERPAPKKAGAPTAPTTKPTQRQTPATKPQPAAQAKSSTAQQPSSRPGKGKARGAQSARSATQRPAQAPASSQSSKPIAPPSFASVQPHRAPKPYSKVYPTRRSS